MFLNQHPQMTCAAEPLYFLMRTKLSAIVPVQPPTPVQELYFNLLNRGLRQAGR